MTDESPSSSHGRTDPCDALIDCLEVVISSCVDSYKTLTFDEKNTQAIVACTLYAMTVESAGDSHIAIGSRKVLSAHVLTRTLLEIVVDLLNVIRDSGYIDIRFQRAIEERERKIKHLQRSNPEAIAAAGHDENSIKDILQKMDDLKDEKVARRQTVRERFVGADMEDYYDTAYSYLCDYSHIDYSTIVNRKAGLEPSPLEDSGIMWLSGLVADLVLKASFAVHEFLGHEDFESLYALQQIWNTESRRVSAHVRRR